MTSDPTGGPALKPLQWSELGLWGINHASTAIVYQAVGFRIVQTIAGNRYRLYGPTGHRKIGTFPTKTKAEAAAVRELAKLADAMLAARAKDDSHD